LQKLFFSLISFVPGWMNAHVIPVSNLGINCFFLWFPFVPGWMGAHGIYQTFCLNCFFWISFCVWMDGCRFWSAHWSKNWIMSIECQWHMTSAIWAPFTSIECKRQRQHQQIDS
jgi:hypothetical protein